MQCQRYEERIVELHSVIAELSRKLDDQQDDVIREESEFEEEEEESHLLENRSIVSDSCPDDPLYEEEDEDYTSLAFERAIDRDRNAACAAGESSSQGSKFSAERDYEGEIQALRQELLGAQAEVQSAKEILELKDKELGQREVTLSQLQYERDNYRRQLQDIKATMEYQEARMDSSRERLQSPVGNSNGGGGAGKPIGSRSSSERRSLRRRRHDKQLPPSATAASEKVKYYGHVCMLCQ